MILNKETGMQIRKLLSDNRISVREVQERLGLESPQSVYKWLHGSSLPCLDNMLALSRLLGVRMEDILVCEEAGRYPLGIEGGAFGRYGEQGGSVLGKAERAKRVEQIKKTGRIEREDRIDCAEKARRQRRKARLSGHPSMQAVIKWHLREQMAEDLRRFFLCPGTGRGSVLMPDREG